MGAEGAHAEGGAMMQDTLITELGALMAEALARGHDSDALQLAFQAVPVGWFSKLIWRFVRVRVKKVEYLSLESR